MSVAEISYKLFCMSLAGKITCKFLILIKIPFHVDFHCTRLRTEKEVIGRSLVCNRNCSAWSKFLPHE